MVDVNIKHIETSVGNIGAKQICVETGNDAQTGHRMWAGKDGAGDTYKFLGKGKPAYIQNLNISEFTTAGLLRTNSSGVIYGDVNTLGELNTALGGTTIDESTDTRDPNAHAIGGAAHTASTLAQLNALVSDATLDDSGDTRDPNAHAIGSASHTASTLAQLNALVSDATLDDSGDTRDPNAHAIGSASHTASTLAQLNALVSDATLDDSGDTRDPNAHAGLHEVGGSDEIDSGWLSSSAFAAIRKAENSLVSVIMMGDSNQFWNDGSGYHGFDYAINNHLNGLYGMLASPIACRISYAQQNALNCNYSSGLDWANESVPASHDVYFPSESGYGSLLSSPVTSTNVLSMLSGGDFDVNSDLRWWFAWAGFPTGSGQFRPRIRINQSPWSILVDGGYISTNTGDYSRQMTYLDLPAATRNYPVGGGFLVSNDTVTNPMTWLYMRAENSVLNSGISCSTLYGEAAMSLRDMAIFMQSFSVQQLSGYFYEARRLHLNRLQKPNIVVYINSGLNDKWQTSDSVGSAKTLSSTADGYIDNLSVIINTIENVWETNGWDVTELTFLTIASHVISEPNDAQLTTYRDALKELSVHRQNLTTVDLSERMTYAEAVAGGWYDVGGVNHLNDTGYAAVTSKLFEDI